MSSMAKVFLHSVKMTPSYIQPGLGPMVTDMVFFVDYFADYSKIFGYYNRGKREGLVYVVDSKNDFNYGEYSIIDDKLKKHGKVVTVKGSNYLKAAYDQNRLKGPLIKLFSDKSSIMGVYENDTFTGKHILPYGSFYMGQWGKNGTPKDELDFYDASSQKFKRATPNKWEFDGIFSLRNTGCCCCVVL
jgi:hypothetical protein